MFALDQASNTFPFAANLFVQLGYPYEPGGEMSYEDESQIMVDLKAIAEYGAPMTAPHGFVEHCDLLEFWDNNSEDIYAFILNCPEEFLEDELEGEFCITRGEALRLIEHCPDDDLKERIIWRLLETIANFVCFDTDAMMC